MFHQLEVKVFLQTKPSMKVDTKRSDRIRNVIDISLEDVINGV